MTRLDSTTPAAPVPGAAMAVAVLAGAVVIVIAYAPFFLGSLPPNMTSPGFRTY